MGDYETMRRRLERVQDELRDTRYRLARTRSVLIDVRVAIEDERPVALLRDAIVDVLTATDESVRGLM